MRESRIIVIHMYVMEMLLDTLGYIEWDKDNKYITHWVGVAIYGKPFDVFQGLSFR